MPEDLNWKYEFYDIIKNGELDRAEDFIIEKMESDIDDEDIEAFLKAVKFWKNRREFFNFSENSGEILLGEWENFLTFCINNRIENKKLLNSFKAFVYSRAIDFLIDSYKLSPIKEKEKLYMIGVALYEVGFIDKALETFEFLFSLSNEKDYKVYLWLANLYYEIGENELSMIMYNDAFFYFSQLINPEDIKDVRIKKIINNIKADGFLRDEELLEWVPVYCYLYDVLTVKRKLEYGDFVDLRERIKKYEKSLETDKKVLYVLIPRLINYYLWIVDYYLYQANSIEPVQSVLKRIIELFEMLDEKEVVKNLKERTEFIVNKLCEKKLALKEGV
ncbi:MAG: hypothetical protein N2258_06220 [Brevinematales bacterium]|nr:hypothetical protein [Brevinematales bacterium]